MLTARNQLGQLEPLLERSKTQNRECNRAERASGRSESRTLKGQSEFVAQLGRSRAIGSNDQDFFGRRLAGEAQKVRLQRCCLAAARPTHRERDRTEWQIDDLLLPSRKLKRVDAID